MSRSPNALVGEVLTLTEHNVVLENYPKRNRGATAAPFPRG